jgi:hypothetical protein
VAGHIREAKSGEPVPGASVYIEAPNIGVSTDQFGYYALTLPVGTHTLNIRGIGIKNTKRRIQLYSDGKLEVEVEEDITTLKEVIVEAEKDKNVAGMQMGVEKLDIKTMKQVPTAFGETDIMRVVLMLPGVKAIGEGSTGISVRGGGTDQNLILFNDATIYNPSHLFGFFSAFNPDILKSVELYKSGIPAKYGGRLSSVLDISTRDGNKKKYAGSGGIGLLTSHLTGFFLRPERVHQPRNRRQKHRVRHRLHQPRPVQARRRHFLCLLQPQWQREMEAQLQQQAVRGAHWYLQPIRIPD